jgi:hypothetical protein
MPFFLFIMIFLSSQHIFCSDKKRAQPYNRYGFYDQSIEEALRVTLTVPAPPLNLFTAKQNKTISQEQRTPSLKGSTEKINDNK